MRIGDRPEAAGETSPEDWLGLGEAARLLGVTPNTLRRWSDRGHLPSFTTPGGHRRFPRASIEALLPSPRSRRPQLSELGASGARIAAAYRRAPGRGDSPTWLEGLPDAERLVFRERGRRMVECLLAHLDADSPGPALANLHQAADYTTEYGAHSARRGAPLAEAVQAFLHFRQPFVDELVGTARKRGLDTREATELLLDAESAMDRLLLAFIEGWQAELEGHPPASRGEGRAGAPDRVEED
jgi:excisionase family DNA binding protein